MEEASLLVPTELGKGVESLLEQKSKPNRQVVPFTSICVNPSYWQQNGAEVSGFNVPLIFLIQEIKVKGFQVICTKPNIYCKVFKDNSGALDLVRLLKLCPRTKRINVCYHHFREHVRNRLIKIFPIGTKDQTADVLTKALPRNDFQHHPHHICGQWACSSYHCERVCNI